MTKLPQNHKEGKIEIRDLRNGDWYWVHKEVYEHHAEVIGVYGLALYNALCFYANGKTGSCFPSQSTICKKLRLSVPTFFKYIKVLEDDGLIKRESGKKEGTSNIYFILKVGGQSGGSPLDSGEGINLVKGGSKPSEEGGLKLVKTNNNNLNKNNLTTSTPRKKYSSVKDITEQDFIEIADKYKVNVGFVKLQFEKMQNWMGAKGKRYKNYRRALMNWVLMDVQRAVERGSDNAKRGVDARSL